MFQRQQEQEEQQQQSFFKDFEQSSRSKMWKVNKPTEVYSSVYGIYYINKLFVFKKKMAEILKKLAFFRISDLVTRDFRACLVRRVSVSWKLFSSSADCV